MAKGKEESVSPPPKSRSVTPTSVPKKIGEGRGKKKKQPSLIGFWIFQFSVYFGLPIVTGVISYYYYHNYWYLPSLVNTPSDLPTVLTPGTFIVNATPERYWGTYRANCYFGLKTRHPESPVFGLMWFEQPTGKEVTLPKIRHWSSQADGLTRYGWREHDGKNFGVQEIVDDKIILQTTFAKRQGGNNGGDWTARIAVAMNPIDPDGRPIANPTPTLQSFILYLAIPGDSGYLKPTFAGTDQYNQYIDFIDGETPELGEFRLKFPKEAKNVVVRSFLSARLPGLEDDLAHLQELVMTGLGVMQLPENKAIQQYVGLMGFYPPGKFPGPDDKRHNFLALQLTVVGTSTFDISFESKSAKGKPLVGPDFDKFIMDQRKAFEARFEKLFQLRAKQYAELYIDMAKFALSNMLGSISYFHGSSKVISKYNKEPVPYGPFALFTAVPSRPFFPRGFLWDEGFHHLLIRKWDPELSLEILGSWFDLMNIEGWIPREQILGAEAEARVPAEYVVQNNAFANPPMFFFLLGDYIKDPKFSVKHRPFLERVYPRLKLWFNWLNNSQAGPIDGSCRWRGRNATTTLELNPKTLTSGLDDYPRASHPNEAEYHVDLFSWMAYSSAIMSRIGELLGDSDNPYLPLAQKLNDQKLLDSLHWSEKAKRYCDYGLHTRNVKLERPKVPPGPDGRPSQFIPEMTRVALKEPALRMVTDTFGYVSLFPLFLQLIKPDSPQLKAILDDLKNPDLLWTEFGLRSLAKTSPMYNQRNTEHDPPYWRGHIWINMNYMALRALHHYSQVKGPHRDLAFEIYGKLRSGVISTLVKEYRRTGYLWERYNDQTGKGEGTHPFTGWSSLVVLMMSEEY